MYAHSQCVPRCNQQTIAAKKVDDTRISRHAPVGPGVDLHAVSLTSQDLKDSPRKILIIESEDDSAISASHRALLKGT